jgi:hypothetical protein
VVAHLLAVAGVPVKRLLLGAVVLLSAACDQKNCQSTCFRIYDPGECNVSVSGLSEQELKDACVYNCNQALKKAGEMGDYNPYALNNENPPLLNETQAAAWMDCVWEAECSDLEVVGGICKPIGSGKGDLD